MTKTNDEGMTKHKRKELRPLSGFGIRHLRHLIFVIRHSFVRRNQTENVGFEILSWNTSIRKPAPRSVLDTRAA